MRKEYWEESQPKYPQILSTVVSSDSSVSPENNARLESDQLPVFNIENLPAGSQFKAIVLAKVSEDWRENIRKPRLDSRHT